MSLQVRMRTLGGKCACLGGLMDRRFSLMAVNYSALFYTCEKVDKHGQPKTCSRSTSIFFQLAKSLLDLSTETEIQALL